MGKIQHGNYGGRFNPYSEMKKKFNRMSDKELKEERQNIEDNWYFGSADELFWLDKEEKSRITK